MIRNRGLTLCRGIEPDLVTSGGLMIGLEAMCFQLSNDVFVAEPEQSAYGQAATTMV